MKTLLTKTPQTPGCSVAVIKTWSAKPDMLSSDSGERAVSADHLCVFFFFESVSGHPLSVWIKTCSVPESMPAIFANGSSLRDLRCRDTGQLEKRKHRSLERCAERFTVNRAAFCEIESGIRMCWWSDTVEVVHTMSSSSWCYWWPHYILSQPDCGVTDTSALCLYCGLSAFNNWVNQRYCSCNSIHLLLGSKFRIQHF